MNLNNELNLVLQTKGELEALVDTEKEKNNSLNN